MCLLFDFSPSHASCSVNAILNHPVGKLLSLLSVVTQCAILYLFYVFSSQEMMMSNLQVWQKFCFDNISSVLSTFLHGD